MKTSSDEQLMREYADGNIKAFDELFTRYGQKIYNLFLRSTGNPELSGDLLQDCFMRLSEARHGYQSQNAFSGWIFTIAMNLLRDAYRVRGRRQVHSSEVDSLVDNNHEPDKLFEQDELKAAVKRAIQELPDEQREVIILSRYHGLSFIEIAEILNISPAAAKQKAYRGMQTLRKKLSYLKEG